MNFPTAHHLNAGGNVTAQADVILGLELNDTWGLVSAVPDRVQREAVRVARPGVKLVTIGTGDLFYKSNYQNFQRYYGADLSIAGDAQASLPALIEAVRAAAPRSARAALARARGASGAPRARRAAQTTLRAARYAWDASPVSTRAPHDGDLERGPRARLGARLGAVVPVAARDLADRAPLPVHRRLGRRGHGLRRAGGRRRRARAPRRAGGSS